MANQVIYVHVHALSLTFSRVENFLSYISGLQQNWLFLVGLSSFSFIIINNFVMSLQESFEANKQKIY